MEDENKLFIAKTQDLHEAMFCVYADHEVSTEKLKWPEVLSSMSSIRKMKDATQIDVLCNVLKKYDQIQLIRFWSDLNDDEKMNLYEEIMTLDFDAAIGAFKQTTLNSSIPRKDNKDIQPIPAEIKASIRTSSEAVVQSYRRKGYEQISENKVAVLILAGGQGTRLGSKRPKGLFDVNAPSGKSLLEIQAQRIIKVVELAKNETGKSGTIPWYIMTSEHVQDMTMEFFEENHYFNLNKKNIIFFEQQEMPTFDFDGKILLQKKHEISKAPDGNGGLYTAMRKNNIVQDMRKRGVCYVHVYCVDNILVRMADPVFIGFCVSRNADCGAKVVEKVFPDERVGVICNVNGDYGVVEYSEIPKDVSELRNDAGKLKYCEEHDNELPYHRALKKIPWQDERDCDTHSDTMMGIKLERFVFDVFRFTKNFVVWEVDREEEFSPLKNLTGEDSPITCRRDLCRLHLKWLKEVGAVVYDPKSTKDNVITEFNQTIEISPLISYAGEGLEILRGMKFASGSHIEINRHNNPEVCYPLKL